MRRFHQNDLLPISLPQKAISYQISSGSSKVHSLKTCVVLLFAVVMTSLVTGQRAEAQTLLYWNTNGGGGWSTANWNTSASGTGGNTTWVSTDVAVFNSSKSGVSNVATTVQLSTAQTAAGLIFSNNTLATALTSSNTTTNTLNLGQYGLVVATGNGPVTIGSGALYHGTAGHFGRNFHVSAVKNHGLLAQMGANSSGN